MYLSEAPEPRSGPGTMSWYIRTLFQHSSLENEQECHSEFIGITELFLTLGDISDCTMSTGNVSTLAPKFTLAPLF